MPRLEWLRQIGLRRFIPLAAQRPSTVLRTILGGEGFAGRLNLPAPRHSNAPAAIPAIEQLEGRLTPAGNIKITSALTVNIHNQAQAPVIGEEVFVRAHFTTQNLPAAARYRVRYSMDGVPLNSTYVSWGAGYGGSAAWYMYWGGWYASPGNHTISVTVNPDHSPAESSYGDNTFSFNFTPRSARDLPQKFISPLAGVPLQNWGITNYVNVARAVGQVADFAGGNYTYYLPGLGGETGHDLTLANFAAMDAGTEVYAAAAGKVIAVVDGNFDRNTTLDNPASNYVVIDCGNGWVTSYYHFRTNTILVRPGQRVAQGQMLGLAGSSGDSSWPHLCFLVYHQGDNVEPCYDPSTFFADPLPYQGDVHAVVDSGVTSDHASALADLARGERPVPANVFTQAAGQELTLWFQAYTRAGDLVSYKFFRPDGAEVAAFAKSYVVGELRGGFQYWYYNLPANLPLGTWHIRISINGIQKADVPFAVTADGAGAARVSAGNIFIPNGRTTPTSFGNNLRVGTPAPRVSFTVANLGSAPLHVFNPQLPVGYTLVGSFPTSIPVGGSEAFTVQLATKVAGTRSGLLSFGTDDPTAPTFSFSVRGIVAGGYSGKIHGQVFDDLDANGIENGSDKGLEGWTVLLFNAATNRLLARTVIGYNGYFEIANLPPGTYRVRVQPPAGWNQSTPNPADVIVKTGDALVSPFGMKKT